MAQPSPTAARFPEVRHRAGHYESFYLKANHPTDPVGLWIRYTVHKRRGHDPRGSLWFTLFDATAPGPVATKSTTEALGADDGVYIQIGEAVFAPGRIVGDAGEVSWDLSFHGDQPPLLHLPKDWMYRARVPRTKLLSPHPDVTLAGTVRAGRHALAVDGWRGVVGHNWGSQHAERWVWLHAPFAGDQGPSWIDAALGRIRLGPWTTPWIATGVLCLDGVRHRLGGPPHTRATRVLATPTRCKFWIPGKDVTVEGVVGSLRRNFVGWVYADPDGSEHHTVNCSMSELTLTASGPGMPERELSCPDAAAYELGMRERDHGMAMQPFPDG